MAIQNRDDALHIIVPLSRQERILLLSTLMEEMNSDDAEATLSEQGFIPS